VFFGGSLDSVNIYSRALIATVVKNWTCPHFRLSLWSTLRGPPQRLPTFRSARKIKAVTN
jgi:hypothetical protein